MHLVDGSEPATHGSQAAVVDALAVSPQPPTIPGFSLQDRVVVITGGASGLGLVMGKGAVESGAHLAIVDINSSSSPPRSPTPLCVEHSWRRLEAKSASLTSFYRGAG